MNEASESGRIGSQISKLSESSSQFGTAGQPLDLKPPDSKSADTGADQGTAAGNSIALQQPTLGIVSSALGFRNQLKTSPVSAGMELRLAQTADGLHVVMAFKNGITGSVLGDQSTKSENGAGSWGWTTGSDSWSSSEKAGRTSLSDTLNAGPHLDSMFQEIKVPSPSDALKRSSGDQD